MVITFRTMQFFSPRLASLLAYQFWFHPGRKNIKQIARFEPQGMQAKTLIVNNKTVCYWTAGKGPVVFLMHGWGSCGKQLGDMGQAFLDHGYKIIWMDAPAHGASSGWRTTIFEISQAIHKVQNQEGEFKALLAHSFGVPSCLFALQYGLQAEKLILISAPATFEGLIEKYCRILKASKQTQQQLSKRLDQFLGEIKMAGISAKYLARGLMQQSLVIHDRHDRLVRSREGIEVQKNLQNSQFMQTEKLGHSKLLNDPQTIARCVMFVQEDDHDSELMSA